MLTGGNEGIGYHMIKHWLERGNAASVADINCENVKKLQEEFPENLICFEVDISNYESVKYVATKTATHFGSINYAVHNACLCLYKDFEHHTADDFKRVIEVNLNGAVNLTMAVMPVMRNQGRGDIFFTSSGVGVTGFINISSYASSKGAIESLARCLNLEYKGSGIRFHIMHPPLTNTHSSSPLPIPVEFKESPGKVGKGLVNNIGLKKFIVTPSLGTSISVKLSYLLPMSMGSLLVWMTRRNQKKKVKIIS